MGKQNVIGRRQGAVDAQPVSMKKLRTIAASYAHGDGVDKMEVSKDDMSISEAAAASRKISSALPKFMGTPKTTLGSVAVGHKIGRPDKHKKTGRPRLVSPEQHAIDESRNLSVDNAKRMQVSMSAYLAAQAQVNECNNFLWHLKVDLACALDSKEGFKSLLSFKACLEDDDDDDDEEGGREDDCDRDAELLSDNALAKGVSSYIGDQMLSLGVWNHLRHLLVMYGLRMTRAVQALDYAKEFVQTHIVLLSALASQSLACRQAILPVMAEIYQVKFKGARGETGNVVGGTTSTARSSTSSSSSIMSEKGAGGGATKSTKRGGGGGKKNAEEVDRVSGYMGVDMADSGIQSDMSASVISKTLSRSGMDTCQDTCRVLSREPIRRSTGDQIKQSVHAVKSRRRKETIIMNDIKKTNNLEQKKKLEQEMFEILQTGRSYQEEKARTERTEVKRRIRARRSADTILYTNERVSKLGNEQNERVATEKEKKKRLAASRMLRKIQSRVYPNREAPDLHIVCEYATYLSVVLDRLFQAFAMFPLSGEQAKVDMFMMVGTVDAAIEDIRDSLRKSTQSGGGGGKSDKKRKVLLRQLLNNVEEHLIPTVQEHHMIWQSMSAPMNAIHSKIDELYELEQTLQMWYNHGEGGLKTAYCSRNAPLVQNFGRANIPPLDRMYRLSLLRGTRRIKDRDDQTIPLPCSSAAALNAKTAKRR